MKAASPKPECPTFDLKEGERLKVISLETATDSEVARKLGMELFLTIFPPLGATYKYIGAAITITRQYKGVGKINQKGDRSAGISRAHKTSTSCDYLKQKNNCTP